MRNTNENFNPLLKNAEFVSKLKQISLTLKKFCKFYICTI